MPSTYSPDLRIELIANGEKTGTWSTITNDNLGVIIEDAISGLASVSVISANQALTAQNGAVDQARCAALSLTTTTTAPFSVYVPPVTKLYVIENASAYAATVYASTVLGNTTAAGAGATIPAGKSVLVRCDGTNVFEQFNHVVNNLSVGGALAVTGNAAVTGNLTVSGTGAFTGVVTGPTASPGTNTTQLATTAFVAATVGTLGTMASQNADDVAITGGTITGLDSALPIASGGTGLTSVGTDGQVLTSTGTAIAWETPAVQPAIGVGQTWQSVSRSLNTTYTNSTGKPIMVTCSPKAQSGTSATAVVGGVTILNSTTIDCCGVAQISYFPFSFIVPDGTTYRINGSYDFRNWAELR